MNAIEIHGLCKSYAGHEVLHDVDFSVKPGRLVGFLGSNGAGKTTTIRILLGLIGASSGSTRVFGQPSASAGKTLRREIGYLPGEVHFYSNMTGRATVNFLAAARKVDCRNEINRLASVLDLDLRKTVRKYSSGMKQKLGLIQALMHKPKLLILDEPTNALDPLIRQSVFAELRQIVAENRTVLFSSHTLGEVEELCDDVVMLRGGRIVENQSIQKMRELAIRRVDAVFASADKIPKAFPESLKLLEQDGNRISFAWSGNVVDLLGWLKSMPLEDVAIGKPSLEDLFLTYYREQ